jgi:hypothetical protein
MKMKRCEDEKKVKNKIKNDGKMMKNIRKKER